MRGVCKLPSGCFFAAAMKNLRPGLDLAFVAWDIGDDCGLRRDDDFVLAILVFHGQRLSIDASNGPFDIGIGHGALRLQIPA
jgi:hypothetical protein